jgi:hypothetical protein
MYKYQLDKKIFTSSETRYKNLFFVNPSQLEHFSNIQSMQDKFYFVSIEGHSDEKKYIFSFVIPNDKEDHAKPKGVLGFQSGEGYITDITDTENVTTSSNHYLCLPALAQGEYYSSMELQEVYGGDVILKLTTDKIEKGPKDETHCFVINLLREYRWSWIPNFTNASEFIQLKNQSNPLTTPNEVTYNYNTTEDLVTAYNKIMVVVANYALSVLGSDSKEKNDQCLKELIDEYTTQTLERRVRS